MSTLAVENNVLPATTAEAMAKIAVAEEKIRQQPQIRVQTEHVIHSGMYARTVRLAPFVVIVSVLIKVPTMLIVNGSAKVFAGDHWHDLTGYNVIPAAAGRKMIYVTRATTEITMIFPTAAKSVEEAEREFTDDAEMLLSRNQEDSDDIVTITGV